MIVIYIDCPRNLNCIFEKLNHIYDCNHAINRDYFDFYKALNYDRYDYPDRCQKYSILIDDHSETYDYIKGNQYLCIGNKPLKVNCGLYENIFIQFNKTNDLVQLSSIEQEYGVNNSNIFWMGTEVIKRFLNGCELCGKLILKFDPGNERIIYDLQSIKYRDENKNLIDVCETDSIELRLKKLLFVGYFPMDLNYLKVSII